MRRSERIHLIQSASKPGLRPQRTCSLTAYDEWANFLGNKALVGALLSRLRHQCHTVKIDGPSLRGGDGDAAT